MSIDPRAALSVVHAKERKALKALMRVYGDDVDAILNGLHTMAARLAIASGITPEAFSAGMKHHWDFVVSGINSHVESKRQSRH